MSEPFIAEIRIFAGNFAPRGWAFCDGQLLPIAQNTALFSLIGTTYGGDGRTTTLADGWTIRAADGAISASEERTIAITRDGPRVLTGADATPA